MLKYKSKDSPKIIKLITEIDDTIKSLSVNLQQYFMKNIL